MKLWTLDNLISRKWAEEAEAFIQSNPLAGMDDPAIYAGKLSLLADFCLIQDPSVVGLVATYNNDRNTCIAFVSYLAVSPAYRRQGLARRLLEAAFVQSRRRRMSSIALHVASEYTSARRLYLSLGFEPTGTVVAGREYLAREL